MQPVTNLALQVTAIHSMIGFQVTDHGFYGISTLNEFELRFASAPGLPSSTVSGWVFGKVFFSG